MNIPCSRRVRIGERSGLNLNLQRSGEVECLPSVCFVSLTRFKFHCEISDACARSTLIVATVQIMSMLMPESCVDKK